MADARISQIPVEDVFQYGQPYTRVSQDAVEVVIQYEVGIRRVRVSQLPIELVRVFGCYDTPPPPPPPPGDFCPRDLDASPVTGLNGCLDTLPLG